MEAADNLLNGGDAQAAYTLLTANESKAAIAQGTHSVKQLQDYERLLATAALRAWKLSPEQGAYLLGRASELGVADRLSLAEYYYGKLDYSKALTAVTNKGALLKTEAMTKNVAERYLIVILEISLKQKNLVLASSAGNALIALPSSFEGIVQLAELAKGSDWRRQALTLIETYLDKNKGLVANAPADSREKLIEAALVLAEEAGDLSLSLKVIDELEGDVKNWQKLSELGQSQLKLGKPEVALKVLTLAKTVADKQPTISALDNLLYSEMMLDKAEAYFSLSKPQEGYQALVDAYEREPIPQTILRGVALIKGAEPYQAILTDWLNLTSQPGDNSVERAAALLQVARELKSDGELELALHVYELSNTLHPQAEARLEAGYLALDLQKSSKAIDLVKEDQVGETQEAAGRIRCEAFRQQGRTGEALSCALNEAAGNPTDAQALKNVAYYANLTGNVGTAARFLERLYQVEPTLETAKQLAFLYEKTEPSKAIKWFSIAFERYGDQQAGMTLLYGALKRGDWNAVARVLPRLQLSKLSRKQQGEVYEARARLTLEQAGPSDEERREAVVAALADMKKARSLKPTTQNRYSIVAFTFELGEVEEAEREYQALPKAEQETVIALNTGGFIADTLGEYSLAASRFERSLAQDIDQPLIVENLAFTYLRDYNNQGAADMFRLRLGMMQAPSPDLEEEQKRQQFQRQLRILEIPFSFLAFNGMSPSRQNIPLAGGVLGVPSSSPFGSVEVTYRPPYIGFMNGRVFEFVGRTQWANKRGGFRPDPDTWQGVIGARFKPFETQNLKLGIEKFLKIGDLTQDNWLIRALWSVTYGGDFLPLIDPETGQPKTGGLYYNLYLEGGKFLEKEATALFYGDARIGYSFNVSGNTIVLPFIYSIGSGNWNDNIDAFAAEAGIGAIIKYRGFENQFYGPLVNIELIGRLGHEIYNNNADLTDRILLGLQASF
ncbi:NfrA family protein [Pseudovibrio flavus]|uniref:NfrA family protein n=1 Tax=Pseudovibrio flavus TaxID=2529854 RepID=UPI00211BF402|nr:hypothetical protein [Pseudovibrio flavus]